jgi:hypothetical protein
MRWEGSISILKAVSGHGNSYRGVREMKPLFAILMITVTCGSIALLTKRDDDRRQKATQTTLGQIVEYTPNNHNMMKYEYLVAGKKYFGGVSEDGGYVLGSSYQVHYNPDAPDVSFMGEVSQNVVKHDFTIVWIIWSFLVGICVCCELIERNKASN